MFVCVREIERERKKERENVCGVCVRERERQTDRQTEGGRERVCERVCMCEHTK